MGAPYARRLEAARAAILGIPFDCGSHPFRIGSRQGPQSVREQSRLMRSFNPELADYNPLARLGLVDCGNLKLVPGQIDTAFEAIERAVGAIVDAGAVPVTFGGDGSITLPQLRAVGRRHPGLAVVHLDSHADTNPFMPGNEYNAGTQFTHAALEGRVDPARSFHIGLRGTTFTQHVLPHTRFFGYNVITQNQLLAQGIAATLDEVKAHIGSAPVYFCLDMDCIDPSAAPGVCAPSWGGLSAREAIDFVRQLHGVNLVAVDINTVSPPHDVNGTTASLAAALAYETLMLLCRRLGLDHADPTPDFGARYPGFRPAKA
ncbi:arginase family protein [Bordetella genomosp. 9]